MDKRAWDWMIGKIESFIDHQRNTFDALNDKQLNFKYNANRWSAAECLKHIMIVNELYFIQLKKIIDGSHKNPFFAPLSGSMGKILINAVTPGSKATETFSIFEPSNSEIQSNVKVAFKEHLKELKSIFIQLKDVNHSRIKLHSPASRNIKFSLEAAMQVIILHTERHMIQAIQEMEKM